MNELWLARKVAKKLDYLEMSNFLLLITTQIIQII